MRQRPTPAHILYIIILAALALSGRNDIFAQAEGSYCRQAGTLIQVLQKNHVRPRTVDSSLSVQVYDKLLNALDPYGLCFLNPDIQQLSRYRSQLDAEWNTGSCEFLKKVSEIYHKRLIETDSIISEISRQPLDLTVIDSIVFVKNAQLKYAEDNAGLKKRWLKWTKYQFLQQLFADANGNDSIFHVPGKLLLAKEAEIRNKVRIVNRRNIERKILPPGEFENYIADLFNNAITSCYDPHSSYFNYTEKKNFEAQISSQNLSFGINLEEDDNGNVIIASLVPGGPAWKSGELHKGDALIRFKNEGKAPVDLTISDVGEVIEIVHSAGTDRIELTVRMVNGQEKTVPLIKEKLRDDENVIKSFVLQGEKKIGYISLPGFYTEFETPNPLGCANDVAKEILKLQKEPVDGLILDLRFNGGGSMEEALGLSGIFIDEGPLCIYKYHNGKPTLLKDMNRGTLYNGPLIIMVNGMSASASEIFAGALQDYNRAVIVGSNTYGKASGQVILPLDTAIDINHLSSLDYYSNELGYIKVTFEMLYRITGGTHQRKGVVPDVHIPDLYEGFGYGEDHEPCALPSDSVNKKVLYSPLPRLPLAELAAKSNQRIAADSLFSRIKSLTDSFKILLNAEKTVRLDLEAYRNSEKSSFKFYKLASELPEKTNTLFTAHTTAYDKDLLNIDAYRKEIDDILIENLTNDFYVEESYRIILDLIKAQP